MTMTAAHDRIRPGHEAGLCIDRASFRLPEGASVGLLLSRQPRRLAPDTPWVRATIEAVRRIRAWGAKALVGTGHRAWSFVHWCCRFHDVPFARFHRGEEEQIVRGADGILVLAMRHEGLMFRLARMAVEAGIPVEPVSISEEGFGPATPSYPPSGPRGPCSLREASGWTTPLPESAPPDLEGYLWHYTRARHGPWPGQTEDEWYTELFEGRPGAEHSAENALRRILAERCIHAGGELIRGGAHVVCFSERAPASLARERAFRPWLSRWDYEPWAIGIRKEAALAHGARPVYYAPASSWDALAEADRWLFQKHEPPATDWSHEREWRILGDVDLSRLAREDWVVYHHPP